MESGTECEQNVENQGHHVNTESKLYINNTDGWVMSWLMGIAWVDTTAVERSDTAMVDELLSSWVSAP